MTIQELENKIKASELAELKKIADPVEYLKQLATYRDKYI